MTPAKCPGPDCSFLFDPTLVPPGAVIACPRCGRKFTLGQAVSPAVPESVAEEGFGFDASPPTRSVRGPRKSRGNLLAIGGVVGLVLAAFGVVAVAVLSPRGPTSGDGPAAATEFRKTDLNFAFRNPPEGWKVDPTAQTAIAANVFAYKRTGPDAWVALSVRDYSPGEPRPGELRDKVRNQIATGFENTPADLPATPAEWAGHKADRYPFRGVYRPTGETCVGDCFAFAHKGIAYWLYSWCPESAEAAVAADLTTVRDGFRTLGQREQWKPSAVAEQTFAGRAVGYKLTDPDRVWAKPKAREPAGEDPAADLLLEGVYKTRERGDQKPRAEAVVLVLDAAENPLAAGREYVERRYKARHADVGNPVEFVEVTGEPEGDPPADVVGQGGPTVRLKMTVGDADSFRSADRLVVLSAISTGGKTVIAEASCPWKERAVWERQLMRFVGSLTAGRS